MGTEIRVATNGSGAPPQGPAPSASIVGTSQGGSDRKDLLELYKLAFDESKFQVNLNWDRTKHYFILNGGIFTIASGLSYLGKESRVPQLWLYGFAAVHSFFAAYAIKKGHDYYRSIRKRLKSIERELAVPDVAAINTTRGMARETTGAKPSFLDKLTITNMQIVLLALIGCAAIAAFISRYSS